VGDLLEGASAWLDAQRLKFMSRTVSYCRGNDSVDVRATIGKTVFEVDSGTASCPWHPNGGVQKEAVPRCIGGRLSDFCFSATQLIASGVFG